MYPAMGGIALSAIFAIYMATVLQHSGAMAAVDQLTWIIGLTVLAVGGGIVAKLLL